MDGAVNGALRQEPKRKHILIKGYRKRLKPAIEARKY